MKNLISELKKSLAAIKKEAENQRGRGESGAAAENFYLAEKEGGAALRDLGNCPKLPRGGDGLPRIYAAARELAFSGEMSEEAVVRAFAGGGFSLDECMLLRLMLKIACINLFAEALKEGERAAEGYIAKLHATEEIDFSNVWGKISKTEAILLSDPAGLYSLCDEGTKAMYRRCIIRAAAKKEISEEDEARAAYRAAQEAGEHIGLYLDREEYPEKAGYFFIALSFILPLAVGVLICVLLRNFFFLPIFFLPLREAFYQVLRFIASKACPARGLPALELSEIPEKSRTLVTVSTLLPAAHKSRTELREKLINLRLAGGRGAVSICVLADLKQAENPEMPGDAENIAAAREVIDELNSRFSGGFLLAVRKREFSKTQRAFIGKERKRGAVEALVKAIKAETPPEMSLYGDLENFEKTKYIFTLDWDTELSFEAVCETVGRAAHPLNKAAGFKSGKPIEEGYGIFVPAAENRLDCAGGTRFSALMAGEAGLSHYNGAAWEFYQDVFGEGIFTGKGLIDVEAYRAVLTGAMPKEGVLSHDIIEGSFLRAAYVSGVSAGESFPADAGGYFARAHRWTRGDFQNIVWLFPQIRTEKGKIKNPLSFLSKLKIFENILRSLVPVFAAAGILLSLFFSFEARLAAVLIAIFAVSAGELFSALIIFLRYGARVLFRKNRCRRMSGIRLNLARAAVNFILLPQSAYVNLGAAAKALGRVFVSRRNLLEWVTAADSAGISSPASALKKFLPTLIFSLPLLIFPHPLTASAAAFFLFSVPFAFLSSKKRKSGERAKLTEAEREKLLACCGAMWRYYEKYAGGGDNFLPPDNVQETPVFRIAHRTSPTNIGMMMLSFLAARDMGFIGSAGLYERLLRTLISAEKLPKKRGHLFNWYDTRTLEVLNPRYLSAVDSGNFVCCITALKEGILEYSAEEPRFIVLAERLQRLAEGADFGYFYNKRRNLMHIGASVSGEMSPSCYDLLMSEARLTSYYAVASRQVPKKHWAALGRLCAEKGRYLGPVSWTGTFFEYFMPHILLPAPENSLLDEALRFCLFCHKKRGERSGAPWGISESGFYEFDEALNYRYKAHGANPLGLKNGSGRENVVSPYSSFLALPFDPRGAMKNLERLGRMDMWGDCGFYEAADFTKRAAGREYAAVRSFMAHHIGMSMLSAANVLFDNIMQKRFMRDSKTAAARSVLEEKVPDESLLVRDIGIREIPGRRERIREESAVFENPDIYRPKAALLGNGEWSVSLTDFGSGVSRYGSLDMTYAGDEPLEAGRGITAVLEAGGEKIMLGAGETAEKISAEFTPDSVKNTAEGAGLSLACLTFVHESLPAELRQYTVKNAGRKMSARLILYFEPSMNTRKNAAAHPAFSRLFVEPFFEKDSNFLLFRRRPRGGEAGASLAAGILEDTTFSFETDREKVLKRPFGINSLLRGNIKFENSLAVADVCCALCIPLTLPAGGSAKVTLALCGGTTAAQAKARFLRLRDENSKNKLKKAPRLFAGGSPEDVLAAGMLPHLLGRASETREYKEAARLNTLGQTGLWRMGISGDYPIIYISINGSAQRLIPFLKICKALRENSVAAEIAAVYSSRDSAAGEELEEIIKLPEYAGLLHPVDTEKFGKEELNLLRAYAKYIVPEKGLERLEKPIAKRPALPIYPVIPQGGEASGYKVSGGVFTCGRFTVTERPRVPWCVCLANRQFGTLVSDCSAGYTFAVNSRENKLTAWNSDTMGGADSEKILLRAGGKIYDLLLGSRAVFGADYAEYYGEAGKIKTRVRISVPEKGSVKKIRVFCECEEKCEAEIAYFIIPALYSDRSAEQLIKSERIAGGICLKNPQNVSAAGYAFLTAKGGADFISCDREGFLAGEWNDNENLPRAYPSAAVGKKIQIGAGGTASAEFSLSFARNVRAAVLLTDMPLAGKREENALLIKSGDPALDVMVNTHLPAQIKGSRLYGRAGFYQCGGAWGFRDQLQDACSLLLTEPQIAREQIFRCCASQFREGDVLHWWHTLWGEEKKGARTLCSDDMLWLPHAAAEYFGTTGDAEFLKRKIAFCEGEKLREGETEKYIAVRSSAEKADVYEHCLRAIFYSMKTGEHGLPLIGSGDWNDGFNEVGAKGRGESVWLAFFAAMVYTEFAGLCALRGDEENRRKLLGFAQKLKKSADENAWNGEWYIRAFYDDGRPMGAGGECEIDALPQAFSVFSGMPKRERVESALKNACLRLVDGKSKIVRLFAPSFGGEGERPGYVAAYPAGIRENGGQYTHGALWLCLALLRFGRTDEAYRMLAMLNPAARCEDEETAAAYRLEPYAVAADISGNPRAPGRGGWSLYTGSAGWMYRVALEFLGIRRRAGKIVIEPKLPSFSDGYRARIKIDGTEIKIIAERGGEGAERAEIPLDGKPHEVKIKLTD